MAKWRDSSSASAWRLQMCNRSTEVQMVMQESYIYLQEQMRMYKLNYMAIQEARSEAGMFHEWETDPSLHWPPAAPIWFGAVD